MQRMNRHRTKLLITLVLFAAVMATAWTATRADARSMVSGPVSNVSKPGVTTIFSGDPDSGAGYAPPPQSKQSAASHPGGEGAISLRDWVRWAGRIWVTLILRTAP